MLRRGDGRRRPVAVAVLYALLVALVVVLASPASAADGDDVLDGSVRGKVLQVTAISALGGAGGDVTLDWDHSAFPSGLTGMFTVNFRDVVLSFENGGWRASRGQLRVTLHYRDYDDGAPWTLAVWGRVVSPDVSVFGLRAPLPALEPFLDGQFSLSRDDGSSAPVVGRASGLIVG